MRKSAAVASAAIHSGAVILLLLIAVIHQEAHDPPERQQERIRIHAPRLPKASEAPGGGGEQSPFPPTPGVPPPPRTERVFIPPEVARVENPRLAVMPAIDVPIDTAFRMTAAKWGDPFGKDGPLSGGSGGPNGIGDRGTGSIGNRDGPGFKDGPARLPRNARPPEPIYMPEPDYAEEARKVKYQGVVVLSIEVAPDGTARRIRVVRSLGMGLDEKAIEAVARWRFRPAEAGGKPVAAPATVEVTFRLL